MSPSIRVVVIIGALLLPAWQAPAADRFQLPEDRQLNRGAAPRVVVNEIHYHPADTGHGIDPEKLQFIELVNADDVTIALDAWSFSDGIDFTFPLQTNIDAGEYILIVKDAVNLQLFGPEIPPGTQIFEWLGGDLGNGGDRIALRDPEAVMIDEVVYSDGGFWPEAADGDGSSLELYNPLIPNEYAQAWRASTVDNGTPGATNSTFGPPAPLLLSPLHSPSIPGGDDPVTVQVDVVAVGEPTVTLFHRRDRPSPGSYQGTTMTLSGGITYSVTVNGQSEGRRMDFYIEADDNGDQSILPAGHSTPDPLGNPSQTFLCKFSDDTPAPDFPTYHVIFTDANRSLQEEGDPEEDLYDATFIDPDGNIFYNVTQRYRGGSSLTQLPRSYRINFNPGQPLMSSLGFPIHTLYMLAQNAFRQRLGYTFFDLAGLPTSKQQFARLSVDPTTNQGDLLTHVYINVERVDGDYIASQDGGVVPERFPDGDGGNLYRGRNTGTLEYLGEDPDEYRTDSQNRNGYQKINNDEEDEWDDLIELCRAFDSIETPDSLFAQTVEPLIDVDEWCRWFAAHMVLGNHEGGIYRDTGDDYFLYFHPDGAPNGPRATMIVWDMDSVFGGFSDGAYDSQETIWRTGNSDGDPAALLRFLRSNAFAPIFVGAIQDFVDDQFTSENMDPLIDALSDDVADASVKADLKDYVIERREFINAEIVSDLTANFDDYPNPYTPPEPAVQLFGTLNQAGTHRITVNDEEAEFSIYDATWSFDFDLPHPFSNLIVVKAHGRMDEELERLEYVINWLPPTVDVDGTADVTTPLVPTVTRLHPVARQPVRYGTQIRYDLSAPGPVRLRVYGIHGRLVSELVDRFQEAGEYRLRWEGRRANGRRLSGGVYFFELVADGSVQTEKVLLVR